MKLRNLFLVGIGSISLSTVAMNLETKVSLEAAIQAKLKSLVESVDARAYVQVSLATRSEKWNLPATGVEAELPMASGPAQVNNRDITSAEIKVYTQIDQIPEKFRTLVEETLNDSLGRGIQKKIEFKKFDPQVVSLIEQRANLAGQTVEQKVQLPGLTDGIRSIQNGIQLIAIAVVVTIAVMGLVLWLFMRSFGKSFAGASGGTTSAHATSRPMERGESAKDMDLRTPEFGAIAENSGDGSRSPAELLASLLETPAAQLVSVLKDCRHAEHHAYAKWIWLKISLRQRQEVINLWPEAVKFVAKLNSVRPVADHFHEDAFYLLPAASAKDTEIPNSQLLTELKREPALWMRLSPLRRRYSGLGLEARIRLLEFSAEPETFDLSLGSLSDTDEEYLLANPAQLRHLDPYALPSWIWVAQMDEAIRKSVLNRFSAKQIGQCWVGAPSVLSRIESSFPASKLERIREFKNAMKASRANEVLRQVSVECARGTIGANTGKAA